MRLCDRDIEAWLDEGRLSINPRPPVERINGATVDVRLGNKFRTFRGHTAAFIDLSGPKDEVSAALDRVMSDEIVLDESEAFYLHPGGWTVVPHWRVWGLWCTSPRTVSIRAGLAALCWSSTTPVSCRWRCVRAC